MKANDEDIKIFHPKKTDGAGADLAELALLMDTFRSNGNMDKASALGKKLASLKPEMLCRQTDNQRGSSASRTDCFFGTDCAS